MRLIETLRAFDWIAVMVVSLLIGIGLAMLFSTSYKDPTLFYQRFLRQALTAAASLLVYFVIAYIPYRTWKNYSVVFYSLSLALLMAASLLASVIRGTVSRLSLFGWQLQPSEFMKVALIIMTAYLVSRFQYLNWKFGVISVLVVAAPLILILLEPDLGIATLLLATWLATLIFFGLPWPAITITGLIMAASGAVAWQWFLADYQKQRLLIFLDPSQDPLGAGYNITQSIVAVGSGGFLGRGLGHGPQSQLNFLPELQTDFIFASIGEELGLIGIVLVTILYAILLWRIVRTAKLTQDLFGQIVSVGTCAVLLVGFAISAGMNLGLLPVTGIPLPLISYGGSNLFTTLLLLGVVQSVHSHNQWAGAPPLEIDNIT